MTFIVTFRTGERAVVPAGSFSEAEERALAAAAKHAIGWLGADDISGVHRVPEGGFWLLDNGTFPLRIEEV